MSMVSATNSLVEMLGTWLGPWDNEWIPSWGKMWFSPCFYWWCCARIFLCSPQKLQRNWHVIKKINKQIFFFLFFRRYWNPETRGYKQTHKQISNGWDKKWTNAWLNFTPTHTYTPFIHSSLTLRSVCREDPLIPVPEESSGFFFMAPSGPSSSIRKGLRLFSQAEEQMSECLAPILCQELDALYVFPHFVNPLDLPAGVLLELLFRWETKVHS